MSSRFATEEQMKRVVDFKGAREYHLQKDRSKKDKRRSLPEAISEYVHDGDIMCESGFGYVRSPLQAYHEIIRQRKKDLIGMGAPMTNFSYLMTLGVANGIHMSYMAWK
jgi:acyl CoA:acetate/3-ketoacid CoA transferase alpha subunit